MEPLVALASPAHRCIAMGWVPTVHRLEARMLAWARAVPTRRHRPNVGALMIRIEFGGILYDNFK